MTKHNKNRRESLLLAPGADGHLRFEVHPDVAFGSLQRALQRSLDLAALSLQASTAPLVNLPELGTFPRQQIGSRLEVGVLRRHHPAWIVGHAVNDLVEALEPLLFDVARICRFAELLWRGEAKKKAVSGVTQASDLEIPLGAKLRKIKKEFPGLVPEDLDGALSSLNQLRICLTHAAGRVRERDCNISGALELSRIYWEYWVEYQNGDAQPLVPEMVTQDEGILVMRRSREPKRFDIGTELQFDVDDLCIIANTVLELSLLLRKNLYSFLRERDVFPPDFKEPELRRTFRLVTCPNDSNDGHATGDPRNDEGDPELDLR